MAFLAAMGSPATRAVGVNGADVYTADGIGDIRVALYTSLVRGLTEADIQLFVQKALKEGEERDQEAAYERDLWLIAFQGRDVRGGKGERTVALTLLRKLFTLFPERAEPMLRLWADYGCWRDLFVLCGTPELRPTIIRIITTQFWADWTAHKADKPFSLLAKWLPREGSALDCEDLVSDLTHALYPGRRNPKSRFPIYRRQVARLSSALKVVEQNMCSGTWAEVKPGAVPGRCLNLNRKAFLNQKLKGNGERRTDEDRRTCASNFKAHLEAVLAGKATVRGGDTVYPHTICRQAMTLKRVDVEGEEMKVLEAQWSAIRDKAKAAGAMGRVLPMCDFSGSMSGIPMDVSLGLGILLSELNHDAFKNCMLSFDSQPHWITFRENMRLFEKCAEAERHGQGLSTNFEAALSLVLDRLVEHSVPACEAPEDIVVFTDMGFDQACRGQTGQWSTLVANMKARFRAAGYVMPRLVIWNLRAAYKEYHARADETGVLMLSGWSPSAMKVITEGIKVQTPYEGMRAVLDDARYDPIRASLKSDN